MKKSGLFLKTWQAHFVRGGINDGSGSFSSRVTVDLEDNVIYLDILKKAMDNNLKVKIKYHEDFINIKRCNCSYSQNSDSDPCYLLDSAELLE